MDNLTTRLREALETLPVPVGQIRIIPTESFTVYAVVESDAFAGMREMERQELVWGRLLAVLDESDLNRVEFVFTHTPSELAAA